MTKKRVSEARKEILSILAKRRWESLTVEEKACHYRLMAATMMVTRPEIAIFPDRFLADLWRENA